MFIILLFGSYTFSNYVYIKERILTKHNYELDENNIVIISTY